MNELTEFNVGGSHQENKLGGIPLTVNPQTGALITVEEGETKTKIGSEDYVFSNNFKLSKSQIKEYKLPEKLEGLSMSDASREIAKIFADRNDGISKNTVNQFLTRLKFAQEEQRAKKLETINNAMQTNMTDMSDIGEGQVPMEEQVQMSGGGWLGTIQGAGASANTGIAARNVVGAAGGIMGMINQASGQTSPDTGKAVLGGAASGAAVGSMIFPGIGTAVGAAVGGAAGIIGANAARKKIAKQTNEVADLYNQQYQEQMSGGGEVPFGDGILRNNQYGTRKQANTPIIGFPTALGFYSPFVSTNSADLTEHEIPYLKETGYDRQAHNEYIESGGTPIVVDNKPKHKYFGQDPITVTTSGGEVYPSTEDDVNNRKKLNINGQNLLRYAPALGNALQLSRIQKPTMGGVHINTNKTDRNYVDEEAMLRALDNQANNANRAIMQSGMSEGARRNMMLASSLGSKQAIGNAFLQAENMNRQIDMNADQIDNATREANIARRMQADENYARDLGAYNTERSKLRASMYNDIGNIGLENTRASRISNMYGYDIDGNYIKDTVTGERFDLSSIDQLIARERINMANASTEAERRTAEQRVMYLAQLAQERNIAYQLSSNALPK